MSPYRQLVVAGSGAGPRALPAGGSPNSGPVSDGSTDPVHAWPARVGALVAVVVAVLALAGCSSATGSAPAPGEYTVAVVLSGGSGKATVNSPARLTVTADQLTAEVVWSSPYYTWMEVDGIRYTPTSGQGENSTFEIPVKLDTDIPVTAETTAMSQPHAIDYTLRFDSSTLVSASE